jgi:hypothetical protein
MNLVILSSVLILMTTAAYNLLKGRVNPSHMCASILFGGIFSVPFLVLGISPLKVLCTILVMLAGSYYLAYVVRKRTKRGMKTSLSIALRTDVGPYLIPFAISTL